MVGRRTQTQVATAQLAAFAQRGGYLVASGITVQFGAIHSAASDWATPITTVMGIAVGMASSARGVTRSRDLEHFLGGKTLADLADPADAVEERERLRAE
jgi:cyanate permease